MIAYSDLFLVAGSLFIGSFLTASSRAWPNWSEILNGRSRCSECGHGLTIAELVPVISFVRQKGQCRHCKTAIWPGHPIGEILALLIALAAVITTNGATTWLAVGLGWVLLFGALVDARTHLLPDFVTLGLIPLGLGASYLTGGGAGLIGATLGVIIGYASLAGLAWAYKNFRGRDGIGMGDAKLLAAGGAWCGAYALPWIVAIGAGGTLVFVAILALLGRNVTGQTAMPFGPGLALGIFIAYLINQFPFAPGI